MQTIGLLSDNLAWIKPLVSALEAHGVPCRVMPFPPEPLTDFAGADCPQVVFNRVAIRTAGGRPGTVSLVRDLLTALELQGRHIINNGLCHRVGASKALQDLVFRRAGVACPRTLVLHDQSMLAAAREQVPDGMLKANVGGFGAGAWAPARPGQQVPSETLSAAFAADGMAVWQQRLEPEDDVVYRVELLGGEVLYRARVPVKPDSFNYCLGNAGLISGSGTLDPPIVLDTALEPRLTADLARICRLAGMDVGSVEYLVARGTGTPCFFDINPVSTYHPRAADVAGIDPYRRLAAWLDARLRSL